MENADTRVREFSCLISQSIGGKMKLSVLRYRLVDLIPGIWIFVGWIVMIACMAMHVLALLVAIQIFRGLAYKESFLEASIVSCLICLAALLFAIFLLVVNIYQTFCSVSLEIDLTFLSRVIMLGRFKLLQKKWNIADIVDVVVVKRDDIMPFPSGNVLDRESSVSIYQLFLQTCRGQFPLIDFPSSELAEECRRFVLMNVWCSSEHFACD